MASHHATDSPVGASRGLILTLRGRAGLSQGDLAALLGVSERAIQAWKAGLSYPSAASLQRLIALHVERGTFTAGREAEEAAALRAAALQEAPRLSAPFNDAWFAALVEHRRPAVAAAGAPASGAAPVPRALRARIAARPQRAAPGSPLRAHGQQWPAGVTAAQRDALLALGAVDRGDQARARATTAD